MDDIAPLCMKTGTLTLALALDLRGEGRSLYSLRDEYRLFTPLIPSGMLYALLQFYTYACKKKKKNYIQDQEL